jgi:ribokinase
MAAAVAAIGRGVRHLHIASVYLIPALVEQGGALVEAAHAAGASVSVDTNFDPSGAFARPEWLRDADVLVPNETEALALAGEDTLLAAANHLAARGALVAVKRGAAGALAVCGDEVAEASAPAASGPDSVGAGDSFDAGLVWALLDRRPPADALAVGCACGALSVRAPGGVDGQATLDEALRLAAQLRSAR